MSSRRKIRSGRLFTISAPSGAGKTTLVKRLLHDMTDIDRSISCTTRQPRTGEVDGADYVFVDEKSFQEMVRDNQFFEWEEVHGSFYGTPKAALLKRRQEGLDTIFDIDVRGALSVKEVYPDACAIFVIPPSMQVLEERLRKRQTEAEASLQRRLANATREMKEKDRFDYVIINDEIERAYAELKAVIERERKKT